MKHPLHYTSEDFAKIKLKPISIKIQYELGEGIWIGGYIKEVYLAANPPHLPGSIDFILDLKSKNVLKEAKIEIPDNIGIMDIMAIDSTSIV
jgi:hypothetical protein